MLSAVAGATVSSVATSGAASSVKISSATSAVVSSITGTSDVTVASVSYNDEDEKNQVILEQFINGPVGNMLSQIDPVGYFTAAGLAIRNTKTKYSLELSRIVEGAANKLSNNMQQQSMMQQGMLDGQGSQSASMNQLNGGM